MQHKYNIIFWRNTTSQSFYLVFGGFFTL